MNESAIQEESEFRVSEIDISPELRGLMDERLEKADSTVIEIDSKGQIVKFGQPKIEGGREIYLCRVLSLVVEPSEAGEIQGEDLIRFERLLTHLITTGLVSRARLCEPLSLPLRNGKIALLWYVFTDHTNEELNQQLGCNCFVDEGELYFGEWPTVALAN